jgi:hypothetical protein
MDIFAHGLWATAAARGANRKIGKRIRLGWAAFFGAFPDLFAFTVPFVMIVVQRLNGVPVAGRPPRMGLAWDLYQVSHSLFVFSAVFGLVWLIRRRPALELLGWPLHILIDIPTHTLRFFPTPFLWPVSSYYVDGVSWANRWFMLVNYSAIAAVYLVLWWTGRRQAREEAAKKSVDAPALPVGIDSR